MPRRTIPLGAQNNGIMPFVALIVIGILLIITLCYIQEAPVPINFRESGLHSEWNRSILGHIVDAGQT